MRSSHTHFAFSLILSLGLALSFADGAEEDFELLTLDSHLIGLIEPPGVELDGAQQASNLIRIYHSQLTAAVRVEVEALHEGMLKLIPSFEVAYTAADSAEIAHVMSEIDLRLAAIQEIHALRYTIEAVDLLTSAYQLILPTFGDAQ